MAKKLFFFHLSRFNFSSPALTPFKYMYKWVFLGWRITLSFPLSTRFQFLPCYIFIISSSIITTWVWAISIVSAAVSWLGCRSGFLTFRWCIKCKCLINFRALAKARSHLMKKLPVLSSVTCSLIVILYFFIFFFILMCTHSNVCNIPWNTCFLVNFPLKLLKRCLW